MRAILLKPVIFFVGDVPHVRLAEEGQHVMLAHGVEVDVLDDDHLPVILREHGRAEYLFRILRVALREELHGLGHAVGRLEQALAASILAQQLDYRLVMRGQLPRLFLRQIPFLFLLTAHPSPGETPRFHGFACYGPAVSRFYGFAHFHFVPATEMLSGTMYISWRMAGKACISSASSPCASSRVRKSPTRTFQKGDE